MEYSSTGAVISIIEGKTAQILRINMKKLD
jgi:hypothetical protein